MRILLIGINFGNYEKRIVETFEKQGHEVFYMYDTDEHYSFYLRIFGEKYTNKKTTQYQNRMLKEMPNKFDRVIVIVGRQLSANFLNAVKTNNPKAKFSLYLWDDVRRVENFDKTQEFYDDIYSFDLKDCRDYGFKHLPLFFTQRPGKDVKKEYDIYSAMFSHSEREKIVNAVAEQAEQLDKNCKFYISLGRFAYVKRRKELNNNRRESVVYISRPIDEKENYNNMEKAKTILDVQFSTQIGLTMRTIESLGMKNKLITTNPSIKYYDIYNPSNVFIISREEPKIEKSFLDIPYQTIEEDIYEKYSLDTWVKTLLGEIELNNYIGKYKIMDLLFDCNN